MIMYAASAIIFLFVSFSLFYRADISVALKIAGSAAILFVSLKYAIYRLAGGYFFAPHLGGYFILCMEALYGALLILFLLLAIWDVYALGNWLLSRAGFPVPHLPVGVIKSCLCGLALALGIWGTWQAVKVPDARVAQMRIANLPEALNGFSITQLSDLHIGVLLKKDWLAHVVEKANALQSDIIALTGDFIDGYVDEIGAELEPLAQLKAPYGVYGVTGNHEYYWNASQWLNVFKNLNIRMLENEHETLEINGGKIVLAGIPDAAASGFGHEPPNLDKALQNAPEAVKILLAHRPGHANEYKELVDLQLSGHTHGGLMFFLRPLIASFNGGFVSGFYPEAKLYLHPGTGLWNGFSSRLGNPSEITKIILQKK